MTTQRTAWQRVQEMVLTTAQVRAVDALAVEKYGMHSLVLMENAAIGCVHWLLARFAQPQATTILCGRGNNGGDGLAIARHLLNCGWPCRVMLLGPVDKLSPDARHNLRILTTGGGLAVELYDTLPSDTLPSDETTVELGQPQLIIDALLGTGAQGNPRPPLAEWITAANATAAFRLAIDVPTGLDAQTGDCGTPTFQADATVTFVARKPGLLAATALAYVGELQVLPIGVPPQLLIEVLDW